MKWDEVIIELIKIASTGLVAALFTAWVALRDHRFKKWWELRVSAYQNLIEALSDVVYVYDTDFDAMIEGLEPSEERQKELALIAKEGFVKVRKAADMGAFIFSEEVNKALAEFNVERAKRHESYFEHLDGMLAAARDCLSKVVVQSRKDLSLHRTFMVWK